ncbi:hypothetical protein [Sphingobacterium sp. IITKGP-BTPF85]|uniref:hypothetical protein n=1 Tax=Sphingobacterium sp. IITKGP-BTPF85 TaxID=1338009 RepID=UPI000389DA7C|nr:hypothetical protein [Sphingobacterium sp. IITKGP-BTPF85]KKX46469.1 hypothetical protein L950_0231780 [Sphingobacterium sp. IITKGP-BTPF85]
MKTLAKTFAAAALIAVSTFTMAAGKPEVSNPKKQWSIYLQQISPLIIMLRL